MRRRVLAPLLFCARNATGGGGASCGARLRRVFALAAIAVGFLLCVGAIMYARHEDDAQEPFSQLIDMRLAELARQRLAAVERTGVVAQRAAVVGAIRHAWQGYHAYARGRDELRPLTRTGADPWGHLCWTPVDALDTLWLAGLHGELAQARALVKRASFAPLITTVATFEACIRLLGGTLAAYELTGDALFAEVATDVGRRLLRALTDTASGLPAKRVSMAFGAPAWARRALNEPRFNSLTGIGTLQLEFAHLARLTGRTEFNERAAHAVCVVTRNCTARGLVSSFSFDVDSGATDGGNYKTMGSGADSFYEYLLKVFILRDGHDAHLLQMWLTAMDEMLDTLVKEFTLAGGQSAHILTRQQHGSTEFVMEQMECFVPGMLALGVDFGRRKSIAALQARAERYMNVARGLMKTCVAMWSMHPSGLSAESYYFSAKLTQDELRVMNPTYLLRPETLESLFIMHRVTGEAVYRQQGWQIFAAIETHCRTRVAYAQVKDVARPQTSQLEHVDKMESFLLAETFKYALLLFSDDSEVSLAKWVFSTEAHPLPIHRRDA